MLIPQFIIELGITCLRYFSYKPSLLGFFVLLRADRKRAIIKPQTGGFDG